MPKPTKGARLGGSATHERMMLRNLTGQLIEHGRITTTETKARRVQPLAEKVITKAKRGDLHSRRLVLATLFDKKNSAPEDRLVKKLFDEVAPALADREGGYTRITKIGPRKGDNAPMAVIELVRESTVTTEANRANRVAASKKTDKADEKPAKAAEVKADEAAEAKADDAGEVAELPAGAHAPLPDDAQPEGFPIKGNAQSKLYHRPGTRFYDSTVAEIWFATDADAEAAGYELPPSQRDEE